MYIHIGENASVPMERIIAILSYDSSCCQLIKDAEKEKRLFGTIDEKKPKSVIITDEGVYISQISPETLKSRGENIFEQNF